MRFTKLWTAALLFASIANTQQTQTDNDRHGRFKNSDDQRNVSAEDFGRPRVEEVEEAVGVGLRKMHELYFVREPELYRLGLFLDEDEPAGKVAAFSAPSSKAQFQARYGYAAVQALKKIREKYPEARTIKNPETISFQRAAVLTQQCPLQGTPRCAPASRRYRTADGTCNNLKHPWKGASMLPMQRFLAPHYEDGVETVRRSSEGFALPSAREISIRIHRDKDVEMSEVTMMFMQWGQFLDHDITSTAQSRAFNGSVPRCCGRGGGEFLPLELMHPDCLPIPVPEDDWFLERFGIRCLEFVRSAPSSRIDCDLGWREQINQVTSYIDASTVYGSDAERADSLRLFRRGLLLYGRPRSTRQNPPDPPEGEICHLGALTTECFRGGDGRAGEQPGLTAFHTVFLRFHNRLASHLSNINPQWSDEKTYQETRRIIGALIQHITYKEFLPIVLGHEVIDLFELSILKKGFYEGYDERVNPAPANGFSTAAFRFGHSLVQNSYMRCDGKHRPMQNNVSVHEELNNVDNIWTPGSVDHLILGFLNQPSQRRDEFIGRELTNHLFQSSSRPFGMDLAAVNIQRGRDHGIPPYTSWREPCGLSKITSWKALEALMSFETVQRFRSLYENVGDIDLYPGGLAEKPVRGGIVGPTFACIIAQQFSNYRKGDRFWYENGGFESSFTPAQLQQIRKMSFAKILCQVLPEVETIQPHVFLSAESFRNSRGNCELDFELRAWEEKKQSISNKLDDLSRKEGFVVDNKLDFNKPNKNKIDDKLSFESLSSQNKEQLEVTPPKINNHLDFGVASKPEKFTKFKRSPPVYYYVDDETEDDEEYYEDEDYEIDSKKAPKKKKKPTRTTTRPSNKKPIKIRLTNVTSNYYTTRPLQYNDDTFVLHPTISKDKFQDRPTDTTKIPDYQVNINIQYVVSSTPKTDITINTKNKRRPPIINYAESSYVPIKTQPYQSSYYKPYNAKPYNSNPYESQNPYSAQKPYDSRKPYDSQTHYDSQKPYDSQTIYDSQKVYDSQNIYDSQDSQRPYENLYDYTNRYEERPFSTSKRPYIYRPSDGYLSMFEELRTTTKRPNYGTSYIDKVTKRPPKIPSYLYYDNDEKVTSNVYYVGDHNHDHNHNHNHNHNSDRFGDQGDRNFVKISSVQGNEFPNFGHKEHYFNTAQQKEGELDLYDYELDPEKVAVDVIPKENKDEDWRFFNEFSDDIEVDDDEPFNLAENETNETNGELPKPFAHFWNKQ